MGWGAERKDWNFFLSFPQSYCYQKLSCLKTDFNYKSCFREKNTIYTFPFLFLQMQGTASALRRAPPEIKLYLEAVLGTALASCSRPGYPAAALHADCLSPNLAATVPGCGGG